MAPTLIELTPAQTLKSELNTHVRHSEDLELMARIGSAIPPAILTQLTDFNTVKAIHDHIRKTLAQVLVAEFIENGASLATTWGLGLLQYRSTLLPLRHLQSANQISLLQAFYLQLIQKLLSRLKTQASVSREGISWLFDLSNQWCRDYGKIACVDINKQATIRITVPEPNIYAQEDEDGHLHLMRILKAFTVGHLPAIAWQKLSPEEQFGGYLFFVACLSGVSYQKLQMIAHMSLLKKKLDAPFNSLLLPMDSSLKLANVYDVDALQSGQNETQRWIPDPLSASIYKKQRKNWQFQPQGSQFNTRCIQLFIASWKSVLIHQSASSKSSLSGGKLQLLKNALDFFKSTSSLISASKTYHSRILPAFAWHYQQGHFESKDLGFPSLERLGTIEIINKGMAPPDQRVREPAFSNESESNIQKTIVNQTHWAKSCLGIIDQFSVNHLHDAPTAIENLEMLAMGLESEFGEESLLVQLSRWMQFLVKNATQINVTSLAFPKALLPPIVQMYEIYADFKDLDAETRLEDYEDLEIESQYSKSNQAILRSAWNSFHEYLIAIGYIEENQFTPIKKRSKLSKVDSEYISQPEFQLARETLYSKLDVPLEYRNICIMVMTLSYRLGLRRSEVSKLSSSHISFLSGSMKNRLSVQWWRENRLKTSSSTRLIPINALLDEKEALWLELMTLARRRGLWVTEDIFHASNQELAILKSKYESHPILENKNFLFLEDVNLGAPSKATASVDKIIKLIHWSLRHPGRSSINLRFHHLRHSCATNTLLLLMGAQLPHSKQFIFNMMYGNPTAIEKLNSMASLSGAMDYSDEAVRANDFTVRADKARNILLNGDNASGSEVYAVSCLLGHSSPMTTLTSYIHIIDLLVGACLNECFYTLKTI